MENGGRSTYRSEELEERLLEFAARTGRAVDALPDSRLGRHIAGQLVRSGTSPAPNYAEACAAESQRDFIHKLSITLKELRESRTWIKLILKSDLLQEYRIADLLDEANQLCRIVAKSILTAKGKCAPRFWIRRRTPIRQINLPFAILNLHFAIVRPLPPTREN